MTLSHAAGYFQWLFIFYFISLNLGYIGLNVLSIISISGYMKRRGPAFLSSFYPGFEPPITVVVPAYNEMATIPDSIRSFLQLHYSQFEIVVVNDGSSDDTLATLTREFSLVPFPEAYRVRVATKPVRGIYLSTIHSNLRVVDKENGGKADSLNAGVNASRYPLFCAVDADSILQTDSLQRVVQPFIEDRNTIASGGTIRVANGCKVDHGFLLSVGLPGNLLALFQIVEYIRAFLFGRLGWSPLNALLIISGAFGLFNKERVIEAGGFRSDTIGEDMELITRLHRINRIKGREYKITFVPDPICWTEAPEDIRTLINQRIRWQRGLSESLFSNIGLLFHPRGGAVGWIAFPFFLIFEWFGPIIEIAGYIFTIVALPLGLIKPPIAAIFFLVSIGFGVMLSTTALLLEEMSFHLYAKPRHFATLMFVAVIENFGYRQFNALCRIWGIARFLSGKKGGWGAMRRTAGWTTQGGK
jgi:cellulose synthase/poly-beta-1,6-N-acetylglucosamine synthase-like glycosyltransferase